MKNTYVFFELSEIFRLSPSLTSFSLQFDCQFDCQRLDSVFRGLGAFVFFSPWCRRLGGGWRGLGRGGRWTCPIFLHMPERPERDPALMGVGDSWFGASSDESRTSSTWRRKDSPGSLSWAPSSEIVIVGNKNWYKNPMKSCCRPSGVPNSRIIW